MNDDIMQHSLKCHPDHYQKAAQGLKPFEIRLNDRDFNIGDKVFLKEYNPKTEEYTGECLVGQITCISDFQQKDNYVVLGIKYTRTDDCIVINKSDVPKAAIKALLNYRQADMDGVECVVSRQAVYEIDDFYKLIQAQMDKGE